MDTKKLLFHMTHIKNLSSILKNGGLLAYSEIATQEVSYNDIANSDIQDRRSGKTIPLPPNGDLHDYIPFYFATRSPMLFSILKSGLDQREIVYIVTDTAKIDQSGLSFVFTDGHAIMFLTEFYARLQDLDRIDWEIMSEAYWGDTEEDPDRKRRRQAEFLVHKKVPLDLIVGFGVKDDEMKKELEELLLMHQIEKLVLVRPNFYY